MAAKNLPPSQKKLEKAREQVRRYQSETGNGRYMGVAYPKL